MTTLSTAQMVGYAKAWLATQGNACPRDILVTLRDYAIALLGGEYPTVPATAEEVAVTTDQIIGLANKWLDDHTTLDPRTFLTQIRDGTEQIIRRLPRWKCSMFFNSSKNAKTAMPLVVSSRRLNVMAKGIDSSLAYCHPTADAAFRRYVCDGIRSMGGDTLLFIGDMMYGRPDIQKAVDESMAYAVSVGIKHLIVDIRNDNGDVPFDKLEAWIAKLAESYAWANSEQVAFMTCLETSEIMSLDQCRQAVAWCRRYAPTKRVIVGAQSISYLQALAGTGAELWYEIRTNPFQLNQQIADQFVADLQQLIPHGPTWAGEYWSTVAPYGAFISKRSLEIGCQGVGSWAG